MKMEVKTFALELKDVQADGTFEGYASVFGNVDSYGDIVEPGAFKKTIADKGGQVPILWQHDAYEPIGVSQSMSEDGKGLFTVGQCNLDVRRGFEAHSLMRQKAIKGLSIGYRTVKDAIDGSTRRLKELDLWEYSPVTFAANQLAAVTAVKSAQAAALLREAFGFEQLADGLLVPLGTKSAVAFGDLPLADRDHEWDAAAAADRVFAWAKGDADMPDMAKVVKAFLWYDSSSPDVDHDDGLPDAKDAYKLPIADVVDGQLKAVPAGIFAAASVLSGGRGGVDIPAADQATAKSVLTRYYDKMRSTFDDSSIVAPWESDGKWSIPTLDLKEGRVLSSGTRDVLTKAAAHALQAHTTLQALLDAACDDGAATPTDEPAGVATRGAIDIEAVKRELTGFLTAQLATRMGSRKECSS
jgi:HK97 family phage prohead protease